MQQPQFQQPQITLEQSSGFVCNNCDGLFFKQSLLIRKWSKVLTGTPNDHIDAIPVFRCEDCGMPLLDFFPRGMKDVEEALGLTFQEPIQSAENKKAIKIDLT